MLPLSFISGMFSPSNNEQTRVEKCTLGLTALLTMAVILLMVSDMVPKSSSSDMPMLGMFIQCIFQYI